MYCISGVLPVVITLVLATSSRAFPEEGYDLSPPKASGYSYNEPDISSSSATNGQSASGAKTFSLVDTIPGGGIPGRDYPLLAYVPKTGFSCASQAYPGYYADISAVARCQVFHICQFDGRQDSFLCPNGTLFNQQYFICDWWFNVDCAATNLFIRLNADIGKVSDAKSPSSSGTASAGGTTDTSKGPNPSTSYDTQGPEAPNQLYDLPEVTKPSGLYSVPDEK